MSKAKSTIKRFKFTQREKRGGLILALVVIGLIIAPKFFAYKTDPLVLELTEEEVQKVAQLEDKSKKAKQAKEKKQSYYTFEKQEKKVILPTEPFDPDTLSLDSWKKLGLSERQAEIMLTYRERIEGFYNIDQLYSAYVLDSAKVNAWQPFLVFNRKKPVAKKIEINTASAEELKSLKGIGEKLSERIVTYREKLGGFASVEQIAEVYGLSQETFQSIKPKLSCDPSKINKILINHIDIKELAAHPFFNYQMAKLIVNYRLQHGPYSSIDEMLKSKGLETEDVIKVEPYINFAP